MPKSQKPLVRSQHPPTQWKLRAADEAVLNKVHEKFPKNPPASILSGTVPVELGGELCVVCVPLLLCESLPAKRQRVLAQLLQQILPSEAKRANVKGIIVLRTQSESTE